MELELEITSENRRIGTAVIRQEGLYYRFCCVCTLPQDPVYRLTVTDEAGGHSIGIPVPEGGRFRLETRIPARHFTGRLRTVTAAPKTAPPETRFVPLVPGEPFPALLELHLARLETRDGTVGIVLPRP